ncbi:MAG: hypothetical protein KGI59_03445 [Patescibacteria group bacterium]|nr:hypothetical protein [Patescibacteria group bacterium]MDE2172946.1 hypothetical protein [Patescibacteria group bacterium]
MKLQNNILLFVLAFGFPIFWQRGKFAIFPHWFETRGLTSRITGWPIHHGHWGLLYCAVTALRTMFFGPSVPWTCVFLLGSGLIIDELPAYACSARGDGRAKELQIYESSLPAVLGLACAGEVAIMICAAFSPLYR